MNCVLGMGSVFAPVLVVQALLMMVVLEMIVLAVIVVHAVLIKGTRIRRLVIDLRADRHRFGGLDSRLGHCGMKRR